MMFAGEFGLNLPELTTRSQFRISAVENNDGSTPYVLHPPTPSATPAPKKQRSVKTVALRDSTSARFAFLAVTRNICGISNYAEKLGHSNASTLTHFEVGDVIGAETS